MSLLLLLLCWEARGQARGQVPALPVLAQCMAQACQGPEVRQARQCLRDSQRGEVSAGQSKLNFYNCGDPKGTSCTGQKAG